MTDLLNYTARFLNTADALDYTLDEVDDLTSRKVEAVEIDGDALARTVRARRGTARATGQADPYEHITDDADFGLWGASSWPTYERGISDRRMAAVGGVDGDGDSEDRWPLMHIDWDAAADELKQDFAEVEVTIFGVRTTWFAR